MKLYEITSEYRQALTVINDCDLSDLTSDEQQDLIDNTLEQFESEFNNKALAIGAFIANQLFAIDNLKVMEQRIQVRRKAIERKVEWLTDYLHTNMEMIKITNICDNQISLTIRNNPPKVIITSDTLLPSEYKEEQITVLIRKNLISDALKKGTDVPGAYLQSSTRLQIK